MDKQAIIENLKLNKNRIDSALKSKDKLDHIKLKIHKNNAFRYARNTFFTTTILLTIAIALFMNLSGKSGDYSLINFLLVSLYLSFPISAIVFIILLIIFPFKRKSRLKKYSDVIKKETENIQKNLDLCTENCCLPKKYQNSYSLGKIIEYFENLRVDTIKEAINLYEDEALKFESIRRLQGLANQQNAMINNQRVMILQQAYTHYLLRR